MTLLPNRREALAIGASAAATALLPLSALPAFAANNANVNTFAELVAYSRTLQNRMNYASAGNVSANHLATERFSAATGIKTVDDIRKAASPLQLGTQGLGTGTWEGDAWKIGGGNVWGWPSYDADLDQVYYGTGNPGPWNADQRPGDNKWTSGIFARDPASGTAFAQLQAPDDDLVSPLAFSPDGKTIAAESWDGTILLWYVATQQRVADRKPVPAAPRRGREHEQHYRQHLRPPARRCFSDA